MSVTEVIRPTPKPSCDTCECCSTAHGSTACPNGMLDSFAQRKNVTLNLNTPPRQ